MSKSLPSAPLAVSHAAAVTNGRIDTSHVIAKINTGEIFHMLDFCYLIEKVDQMAQ